MEYFIGFVVVFVVVVIIFTCHEKKNKTKTIRVLSNDGYQHIFHGGGDSFMAFNIKTGKIRFGKLTTYTFVERPISFITNHEWKWIEKDAQKTSNKFLFYISDVKYYMQEIYYYSESRKAEVEWAKLQAVMNECVSSQYVQVEKMKRNDEYDFFISHASEDKEGFVRSLVDALTGRGLNVWYDDISLEIGDSLRQNIDQGLGQSRYGIVVLSEGFFSKQWPQYELDALVNKSMSGEKVILPIWHGVEHHEVSQYSNNLADKVAFKTSSLNVSQMADEFLKIVQRNG